MSIEITTPLTAEELEYATSGSQSPEYGVPILPIPEGANINEIKVNGQKPTLYPYRDADGDILFYIARVDSAGSSKKIILPVCRWRCSDGREKWKFKQPLEQNRPLLNLPQIIKESEKPIMIGEGEKVALAARKLFPGHIPTTSCNGSGSASKTDWSIFKDRDVIIAIDGDQAGQQYGDDVYKLCKEAGARSIKLLSPAIFANYAIDDKSIVARKRDLPTGYDLADAAQEGWTHEHLNALEVMLHEKEQSLFVDYREPNCEIKLDEEEWPEPEPIKCELLPVEPFDIRLLPESLQDSVDDIANRMQCPLDHIAIPSILMFSSLIGAGCGIRPKKLDNWTIIPNLWGGIVGAPGTLKSPALEEALKPLNALESKAQKQHEADMASYSKKLKEYEKNKESPDVDKPIEPICRRFKTNDPTIEKLGELLKQNPRGLSLVRDELIGLLVTWDKKGHESDRAFFIQAWNGYGSYTTDRIARGTIHCDNMCVSIVGGTQPSKLSRYLQEAVNNTGNDGLMQRFQLLVYPDENGTWEYVDQSPNREAQKRVLEIAEKVASGNPTEYGAITEEGYDTPYFHFSDDAQSFFIQWFTEHESTKVRNSEDCSIIIEHLSKYRKLMPALALISHIIDIADGKTEPGPVTLNSAKRAAAWCDYLESHARRIYGTVLTQSKGSTLIVPPAAITLSEKIKSGQLKDGFTLRDVYRNGWRFIGKDPKIAKIACDFLIQIGWIRVQNNTSDKSQGGPTYQINPKIEVSKHE